VTATESSTSGFRALDHWIVATAIAVLTITVSSQSVSARGNFLMLYMRNASRFASSCYVRSSAPRMLFMGNLVLVAGFVRSDARWLKRSLKRSVVHSPPPLADEIGPTRSPRWRTFHLRLAGARDFRLRMNRCPGGWWSVSRLDLLVRAPTTFAGAPHDHVLLLGFLTITSTVRCSWILKSAALLSSIVPL